MTELRSLYHYFLLLLAIYAGIGTSRTLKSRVDAEQEQLYAPLDYAVLGQQKSGTSTLWMNLQSHPEVKWVGNKKETLWFSGDYRRTTLCDNDLDTYQRAVEYARAGSNRTRVLVGDWSATHLSCTCCPLVFKTMNPKIKLIAMLRDPVERTLSRFMEQKVLTFGACHKEVLNETFEGYVAKEVDRLQSCKEAAARYVGGQQAASGATLQQQQQPLAGWGAGMDLGAWMLTQCAAKSNILGWSMYDVFLENYLAHFPREQVLVLYTEELAAEPLAVVHKVEAFLGVEPGNYSAEALSLVYNSRGCYSWQCAKKKVEVRRLSFSGGGLGSPASGGDGNGAGESQPPPQPRDGPFTQAMSRLVDLYRPHVQRLVTWADQGRIAQPPEAWRVRYGMLRL